jgi:uridine kinase
MEKKEATAAFILEHCSRYPQLQLQDLFKALYQSTFGCGHLVNDPSAAAAYIDEEASACVKTKGSLIEPLDGEYYRVHLAHLSENGLKPSTLAKLFVLSAEKPSESLADLEKRLNTLLLLTKQGRLSFSYDDTLKATTEWRENGFPARHHSEVFRNSYAPAYRVLSKEYVRLLPLLADIDRLMEKKSRILIAIDGGSASGKTTLASELKKIYPCNVFHMDDFFLRPEQRTAARYAEPGGNVDRERFFKEVLLPLTQGQKVLYRPFDCRTLTIGNTIEVSPKALNIIEGAYSMHPLLADFYDYSVFLKITNKLQQYRIKVRNTPEMAERFFKEWIPLEETYFKATDTENRCDLIIEA